MKSGGPYVSIHRKEAPSGWAQTPQRKRQTQLRKQEGHTAALSACHGALHKPNWASVGAVHPAHHEPQNSRDTGNLQHAEGNENIQEIHFWSCTSLNIARLLPLMGNSSEPRPSQHSPAPYRGVVLHDGVVQLVALAGPPSEEASLADIHIELLQAPIPGEIKRPQGSSKSQQNHIILEPKKSSAGDRGGLCCSRTPLNPQC